MKTMEKPGYSFPAAIRVSKAQVHIWAERLTYCWDANKESELAKILREAGVEVEE